MTGERIEVLLVGIDAACAEVVDPLIEEGTVPTIAELAETGVSGPLQSQIPPWTASAWPSLYTGTNPGKHGVFGFLGYDGYDWDVVNATHVDEPSLWELADEQGLSSVVVNVPVTAPPTAVDGAVIPGYTAPENPPCHPEGILEELREAIGEYRVYPDDEADQPGEYVSLVEQRGDAFRYLADRFDPDFGFLQFQGTDSVFHEYPDDLYPEAGEGMVEAIYRAVDREIGAILDEFDVGTVLLASDHGMGPYGGDEFRVNEFLREQGYVETTQGGMPAWLPILNDSLRDGETDTQRGPGLAGTAVATAAKLGVTPARAGRLLRAVRLDGVAAKLVPAQAQRAGREGVDFATSTAYVRSWIELGVRINLAGREPEGVVPEEEYESVREGLIQLLSAVRTPDGDPVFSEVARRETYFEGPHVDDAVDVVTVPRAFETMLSADLKGETFGPPAEPWNHKMEGLLVASGEAVASEEIGEAQLFDVAPTVCSALSIPRSDRMDGRALPFVRETGAEAYDGQRRERRETDDEAVEGRLAALGYLEGSE